MLGGKAFLEHLQDPEPLPGQMSSTFTLHIHFRNQRFHSKPVPCSCEPDLKEGFFLEIHRDGMGELVVQCINPYNTIYIYIYHTGKLFSFMLLPQERVVKWQMRPLCYQSVTQFSWCSSGLTPLVRQHWSPPTSWIGERSWVHPVGRPALLWSWWELVRMILCVCHYKSTCICQIIKLDKLTI